MTGLKLGLQKHLPQYLKYDYCSTTYGKKVKEVTVFSGKISVCYQSIWVHTVTYVINIGTRCKNGQSMAACSLLLRPAIIYNSAFNCRETMISATTLWWTKQIYFSTKLEVNKTYQEKIAMPVLQGCWRVLHNSSFLMMKHQKLWFITTSEHMSPFGSLDNLTPDLTVG